MQRMAETAGEIGDGKVSVGEMGRADVGCVRSPSPLPLSTVTLAAVILVTRTKGSATPACAYGV